jgi:hypothetical protein
MLGKAEDQKELKEWHLDIMEFKFKEGSSLGQFPWCVIDCG